MDFGFREDQEELRRAAADYFGRELPVSFTRARMEEGGDFPRAAWQGLASLGWIGLAAPERFGGSGLGLLELVLALEEAGRVALGGPFASTVSLALPALLATGDEVQLADLVPGVVAGTRRLACAIAGRSGRWGGAWLDGAARREGGGFVLDAERLFVPDASSADTIVVVVPLEDGHGWFAVPSGAPGLAVEALRTVDETRRLDAVRLDGVRVGEECLLGRRPQPGATLETIVDHARVATAAGMVGAADRALAMTVEYVAAREQFGRAIATFQVVQHRAADMKVAVEHARSLVYYAAWAADTGAADAPLAAAMAKAFASDACPAVAADAIQLHGGIGFTWEHDLHLFFKRLKADEQTFGDATACRERVASILESRP